MLTPDGDGDDGHDPTCGAAAGHRAACGACRVAAYAADGAVTCADACGAAAVSGGAAVADNQQADRLVRACGAT